MKVAVVLFVLGLALAGAAALQARTPTDTSIQQYPSVAGVLRSENGVLSLHCVGTILNYRSVLTSAYCVYSESLQLLRIRVGSSQPNSNGVVYELSEKILHPNWVAATMQSDLAILRTASNIQYSDYVQPGRFGGYVIPDESLVNTVGWGYLSHPRWYSAVYDDIKSTYLWTVSIGQCRPTYSALGFGLRDDQMCTGMVLYESTAFRDKCFGEPGAPVFADGLVVGVRSFGLSCTINNTPSVSVRISSYINWISENA